MSGVVKDDDRRLAAEFEVDPLQGVRGGSATSHARAHRTRHRHHGRHRVLDERSARIAVAADDVKDAFGQHLLD